MHVHLLSSDHIADRESLESYMSVVLPHWLHGMLLHGITTVRTLGAPIEESLEIKNKIAMKALPGPRIVASGPGLTSPQGHPAATMYRHYPDLNKRFVRVASTVEEARAAINEIVSAGMDSPLKLVFQGGEAGSEPYTILGEPVLRLAPEVLKAAIDEAHALGYRVSAHTNDYEDALTAVLAGVDGIEHGVVSSVIPDDRLLRAMVERGTFLVSTLRLHQVYNQPEALVAASSNLMRLHDGGVRIVAGSDTPVGWTYPGLHTIYEIELLVAAGLTPLEAIKAATFNASLSLEHEDQIGRVREGLLADLVIVDGDLVQNISLIRFPRCVIKGGKVVRGFEFTRE
jgi:imidazolonepropionase-like amidohydrolase